MFGTTKRLAAWYRRAARKEYPDKDRDKTIYIPREAEVLWPPGVCCHPEHPKYQHPRRGAWVQAWVWVEGPDVPKDEQTETVIL